MLFRTLSLKRIVSWVTSADLPAQRSERRAADVHAVDGHAASRHVVEARDEVDERGLPRP
jgi:hypothetical protein